MTTIVQAEPPLTGSRTDGSATPSAAPADLSAAVACSGLTKAFGGVRALNDAAFSARAGEVHALVGENGAGKSTLIKAIGGRLVPDAGVIRIKGKQRDLSGPESGHALGIRTVFQELTLMPSMTVAENLLIGREPRGALGLISRTRLRRDAEALLARMGIEHVDPLALVEEISLAERQIVEIVRAVSHEPDILLLDEPTSSLVEREVLWLYEQIRRQRDRGACIMFTSHRWNEIRNVADRITVFRGGREVGTFTDISEDEAVTLMTGRRVEALYPSLPASKTQDAALDVRQVSGNRISDVSLTLHRGEVLGIGGLAGHGHRELFFALFGAERIVAGEIALSGKPVRLANPHQAIRNGIALVPEDRKTEGLFLRMSIRDNMTLAVLDRVSRAGILRFAAERKLVQRVVGRLGVRMPGASFPVGVLSGGNQQKVLIGRWLLAEPRILLLYDITRGVDVATKHELYNLVVDLAKQGHSVLIYSSDAAELAHLCHRVLVMREGRVAKELTGDEISTENIVSFAVRDAA